MLDAVVEILSGARTVLISFGSVVPMTEDARGEIFRAADDLHTIIERLSNIPSPQ